MGHCAKFFGLEKSTEKILKQKDFDFSETSEFKSYEKDEYKRVPEMDREIGFMFYCLVDDYNIPVIKRYNDTAGDFAITYENLKLLYKTISELRVFEFKKLVQKYQKNHYNFTEHTLIDIILALDYVIKQYKHEIYYVCYL